ncbi:MAG: hypothetical protein ACRDT6_04045 [Micromonosporaceae bacterium]
MSEGAASRKSPSGRVSGAPVEPAGGFAGTFPTDEANSVDDVVDSPADEAKKSSGPDPATSSSGDDATSSPAPDDNPDTAVEPAADSADTDTVADQAAVADTPEPATEADAAPALGDAEDTAFGTAAVPAQSRTSTPGEPLDTRTDEWSRESDWTATSPSGDLVPAAGYPAEPHISDPHHDDPHHDDPHHYDDAELDDEEWADEYDDVALFSAIFSAPSLALAAFVFALTGLLGGMIPESLPYLVQLDPTNGPAYHVRIVGLIALGFAIVAASLGLAAMLRSIGSPLRWPRYLGGAAVLLALLIALQSVLLIVLAWLTPEQGGMN